MPGGALACAQRRKQVRQTIARTTSYLVLSVVGVTMLVPFLWMLSTSLKDSSSAFDFPPKWIPHPATWRNYLDAWTSVPFGRFYFNSILVGVLTTAGQVLTSALAAYGFARLRFPGRDKLFLAYLATMMIPGSVTMIPVFILIKQMGLIDSYTALILPGIFSAYGTFLLRQFFMTLPRDLEEAARIDGCSLFGIFWKIILPLSKPALATLTTFTFMGSWNNFMWPLIVVNSMDKMTLPVGLQSFQSLYSTEWTLLMAGSIIVLIPVVVVFLMCQRYFIEGIQMGAIKG